MLDGIDVVAARGEVVGLVGESGSGKSTILRIAAHLMKSDAGEVRIDGVRVDVLKRRDYRRYSGRVQLVFQDPRSSFDPRWTIGRSIAEVGEVNPRFGKANTESTLLEMCGLPERFAQQLPREVSGGELQRAAIARALAAGPELLLLDEPTSALDVSVQGQVLSLLLELRESSGLAIILATHNFDVVEAVCDKIIVLSHGVVAESGRTEEVIARPRTPYTVSLLESRVLRPRYESAEFAAPTDGVCRA